MAVLPPRSSNALPKAYRKLMTSEDSTLTKFYPQGEEDMPEKWKEHEIDITKTDAFTMPPLTEKITVESIVPPEKIPSTAQNLKPLSSLSFFSVVSLQQYTNSFMEDNLINKDKLSKVYFAELPDGKVHVGHPDYEITEGSVIFKGGNLLEL